MKTTILVAGATGNLGERIVKALVTKDAEVRVLVRASSNLEKVNALEKLGTKIYTIHNWNTEEIATACKGVDCVVSVLSGLREVIIDAQKILLDGAIAAGVSRFIPSDYSLDFTKFAHGENRNLDWRREFHTYLDKTNIKSTSIFNGAFADMLTGQMPLVLFKQKKILCWGDAHHKLSFTTMDNTAAYTANAAMDASSPRYLRIAGDLKSPSDMQTVMNELSTEPYKIFRPGGQGLLGFIIKVARFFSSGEKELYPAWQGMQYMHNMIDDRALLKSTDNERYPNMQWTSAKDVLSNHLKK
jgi:NAD(P)-dependent dehydrogenase (short-subunit alcohol dehydrogenase family)